MPKSLLPALFIMIFFVTGCYSPHVPYHNNYTAVEEKSLDRMGYTIQVGAFSNVENASRLSDYLNGQGLDAYHFVYKKGLYKVRFGNFLSGEDACKEAVILKAMGVIDDFYIVSPGEYAIAKERKYGKNYLRNELATTANTFIGVPYLWGGSSVKKGFDCSGLAMTVYKLNGLNLPRTSVQQYRRGAYVKRNNLSKGDLVFFDTAGKGKVSHVGIYIGDGKFIHAPRKGKTVRISLLSNKYYKRQYQGARSYL